jgi:Putative addiction module component
MSAPIQIDQMTLAEKLQTMETLWDDLCRREADVPVPSWQKAILDEREHLIEQGKARFSNWEAAKKRLSKKCRED